MKKVSAFLSFFCLSAIFCPEKGISLAGDMASNRNIPPKIFRAFGNLKWKFKTSGKIFASPAIYKDLVFIGSEDGNLYALHTADKKLAWKFATGGAVHSKPAIYKDLVYFSSYDGNIYAVNAISGKLLWKFKTKGEKKAGARSLWGMKPVTDYMDDPFDFFLSSPTINEKEGVIYMGSGDGNIYALKANDGSLQWKFKTKGIVHTRPALYNGNLYVTSWDQYIYALDSKTGKEKWKFKTGADSSNHLMEGIQSSPLLYNRSVYFGARDGYFYALNAETGNLLWKYSAGGSWILTTAAAKNNTIYLGTSDTYVLLALDARTGKEKFRAQANGYIYSSPTVGGNTVYFGDFTGQLFAVDINSNGKILDKYQIAARKLNASKRLNKGKIDFAYLVSGMDLSFYSSTVEGMNRLYSLGPILSSPTISNGIIYFGSADSSLYALKLKDQ